MDPKLFCIFENTDWSASEEYALLNAIEENGYGNWEQISNRMTTRSPAECEQHYKKFYIEKCAEFDVIPKHTQPENVILPNIITPYNFRTKNIEEPPRCLPRTFTSTNLAGYMAARSDFEHPYDSNAEQIMSSVSKSLISLEPSQRSGIVENLACAVYQAYNNRLMERSRRYKVMQTHGLIMCRKSCMYAQNRFEGTFPRHIYEKFVGFAQFMNAGDFDFLIHSLNRQRELQHTLLKLKAYRGKGIRSLHGIKVYHQLRKRREETYVDLHSFFNRPDLSVKKYIDDSNSGTMGTNKRSAAAPLEILGLPGYERLTENEKQLCSNVRLVPEAYLEFKQALIAECDKWAGLRLLDARKAIRIDVNKTRKLYDFLIEQGHIFKPNA